MNKQPAKLNTKLILSLGALGVLVCVVIAFAAWSAVNNPAFASILGTPTPQQEVLWAQVEIAKPHAALDVSAFAEPDATATPIPEGEPTIVPDEVQVQIPTDLPTTIPTDEPLAIPEVTETPGSMAMDILVDTPTSEYIPPATRQPQKEVVVASSGNGGRWIDVDLTNQSVYAYEGDTMVNSFLASTGTWLTPTVTGQYKVYIKYRYANMSGPGYFLPDVPYVMYFYGSYGIHGTYWHNNFGTPMSHGCVNLSIGDAGWLFDWASVGTLVNVHY